MVGWLWSDSCSPVLLLTAEHGSFELTYWGIIVINPASRGRIRVACGMGIEEWLLVCLLFVGTTTLLVMGAAPLSTPGGRQRQVGT